MGHGGPDWSTAGPLSTVYTLEDMAELAARLGSINVYDRRGNIIWMDNFESGIDTCSKRGSAGFSVDWDGNYSKTGGFSCKLTTGVVANYFVAINKHIGYPVLTAMGIESSFSRKQNWRYLDIGLRLYDGTHTHYPTIRYDCVNSKLQYYDIDGRWQDIVDGSYSAPSEPEEFDTLKLTADYTTGKYKYLLLNSLKFDLSGIPFYKTRFGATPSMMAAVGLITNINAAAIAYIDDIIITQNEP